MLGGAKVALVTTRERRFKRNNVVVAAQLRRYDSYGIRISGISEVFT